MNSILTKSIAIALGLAVMPLAAQDKPADTMTKKERRAEVAEMYKKVLDDMKRENEELQKAVTEMNSATGEQKVNAIAAAVSKLAATHQAQVQRIEQIHEKWSELKKARKQQGAGGSPQ